MLLLMFELAMLKVHQLSGRRLSLKIHSNSSSIPLLCFPGANSPKFSLIFDPSILTVAIVLK